MLPAPGWIRALGDAGFTVVDHRELRAPAHATGTTQFGIPAAWAQRWPSKQTWVAVLR